MDLFRVSEDDVRSAPIRARLFAELTTLRRPASTDELARRVDRHPTPSASSSGGWPPPGWSSPAGRQLRGRPRHLWAIAPGAQPGGAAPRAQSDLSRWLARAMPRGHGLAEVEACGREIGRELALEPLAGDGGEAMEDAPSVLGLPSSRSATSDRLPRIKEVVRTRSR